MSDREQSPGAGAPQDEQPKTEHLNIKVTDNNNEVFFKIKRTTQLSKLMNAFCDRQGKQLTPLIARNRYVDTLVYRFSTHILVGYMK